MSDLGVLDALPTHVATWSLDEADAGVEAWLAFTRDHGLALAIPADLPRLLESMRKLAAREGAPHRARGIVLQRLATVTNQALQAAGRGERMQQLSVRDGEPLPHDRHTWVLVNDDTARALTEADVARFATSPGKALLWSVSTLPLAAAMFAFGYYGVEHERMDLLAASAAAYALWFLARRWIRKHRSM